MPINAAGMPTSEGAKMLRVGNPAATMRPARIRLVEVPIKVEAPPRMEEKLIGINNLVAAIPVRWLKSLTTGIIIATRGVLLRKALAPATGGKILI